MDLQVSLIFKKMLDPKFDWSELKNYDTLVGLAQEAVVLRDLPQRILGKIVVQVDTGKSGTLAQFAKDVGVSKNGLQIYSWVERRLDGLSIPDDIPWSAIRVIAGTDNPQEWMDKVISEGLSFAEVKRQIAIERGDPVKHPHKTIKCDSCGFKTEGVKCGGCGEVL